MPPTERDFPSRVTIRPKSKDDDKPRPEWMQLFIEIKVKWQQVITECQAPEENPPPKKEVATKVSNTGTGTGADILTDIINDSDKNDDRK